MKDIVISAKEGRPREFDIPADPDDPDQKMVTLVLPESLDPDRYEIVKKEIPVAARKKGPEYRWINNYGIKENGNYVPKIDYYVVVEPFPSGEKYVYFDGNDAILFAKADINLDSSEYPGKCVLTLHIGDPTTGGIKPFW